MQRAASRWGYLKITRTCIGCGRKLPINGPVELVRCASCFTVNPMPMMVHGQVLEIVEDDREKAVEGEVISQSPVAAGGVYSLTWGIHAPKCRECGSLLPDVGPEVGDYPCPLCRTAISNFAPTGPYQKLYPAVTQVVLGERETRTNPPADEQISVDQSKSKPVLMACQNCGGSLSITAATPRLHLCEFCGAKVGIPGELWERLHPVDSTRGWYVRFQGPLTEVPSDLEMQMNRRFDELSLGSAGRPRPGPSRWAKLEVALKCRQCGNHVPVNGPLPHVVCGQCGSLRELPPEHVAGIMSWVGDDQPCFDGTAFRSGQYRFQMKSTRVPPTCEVCGSDLPLVEPGADTTIPCPGCTARYSSFSVPEHMRPHAGTAKQLYCAQKEPDPLPDAIPESLGFGCPSCGAKLTITSETGRVHRCEFCSTDVFFPDELWTRLHPVTRVHPWWVDAVIEPPPPVDEEEDEDELDDEGVVDPSAQSAARPPDSEKRGLYLIFGAVGVALVVAAVLTFLGKC